jgi:hypothetical protein
MAGLPCALSSTDILQFHDGVGSAQLHLCAHQDWLLLTAMLFSKRALPRCGVRPASCHLQAHLFTTWVWCAGVASHQPLAGADRDNR